ncbi:protein-L-isoaspartate O-methyltransferase [uncultured Rhodoblastus sp.]|uniref:protein-L-isoaspartate O-methyltransferase family protein n=1 Tax=uncultured Rhodoblastus sp. TaxID=543037 RepID=UPI0026008899|nr:protein-L-isoaspartate O-methyltransferase [uncultured Rhodoblastus sp.]
MQNPEPAIFSAAPLAASASLRETMVERQIRTFDVTDAGVLARMGAVARELFVDPNLASLAYSDASLTVTGARPRELTAPLILARLLKEARLREGERALVVAGGSGYAAALIAGLVGSVVSLDDDEVLSVRARDAFAALALGNATALVGPLAQGAPKDAPFDLILVDGVSQGAFGPLFEQLSAEGRLVAIVAEQAGSRVGKATLFQRADGHVSARVLFDASAGALAAFARPREFIF